MKLILGFALSLVSAVAIASPKQLIFKGHGDWRSTSGEKGSFQSLIVDTEMADGSHRITASIEAGDHQETSILFISTGGDGNLVVKNPAGDKIGWGYSYDLESEHLCHVEYTSNDGSKAEMTMQGNLDGFKAIGSKVHSSQTITWIEEASRIYPAEQQ